jgi:hypothetical protein
VVTLDSTFRYSAPGWQLEYQSKGTLVITSPQRKPDMQVLPPRDHKALSLREPRHQRARITLGVCDVASLHPASHFAHPINKVSLLGVAFNSDIKNDIRTLLAWAGGQCVRAEWHSQVVFGVQGLCPGSECKTLAAGWYEDGFPLQASQVLTAARCS